MHCAWVGEGPVRANAGVEAEGSTFMTLKQKILIGYGVVFVCMGLVVAWSVINLVSLGRATDAILSENYRSILAAENMVDALERQDSAVLLLFLGDAEKGIAQFRENEAVFLEWLARAKDNVTIPGEAEIVGAIETGFGSYRARFSELTELRRTASDALPLTLPVYHERIHGLFSRVRETSVKLRALNEETMYAASLTARGVARRAIWSTSLVAAGALGLALVFSLFLAERIARPIRRLAEASRKISSGDYGVQVPEETGDELGILAREFNRMARKLAGYHEINIERIIAEKNKGQAILSSIEDGLILFDTDLRVTAMNPAARRMLSAPLPDAEGIPISLEEALSDSRMRDLVRRSVKTGFPPKIPDEDRILTISSGETSRHYLFSVTAIRGRERDLRGVVLVLRDVTRLKEVERLKSEFITAASHELRTPLTSLGMSVDLLLEKVSPNLEEEDRELLQAAHEEVHRMKALVSDLLDLSKIEAGRIDLEFERTPVAVLFEHARSVLQRQLDRKGIGLTAHLGGDLPPVRADANKITWVLTNLISNASRYVEEDGNIRLAAEAVGPNVHFTVADDGPGIPPEYQTRIFQKFVQVQGRPGGGSGLGLAICKEIVRAHGGTIWVESRPGEGSAFTFTLPKLAEEKEKGA
jgi:two-component system, NtrC family, sensor histidine kinase KinB